MSEKEAAAVREVGRHPITPRPWRAEDAGNGPTGAIFAADGRPILSGHVVYKADAALIAAAPDLLEKCEQVVSWLSRLAKRSDELAAAWADRLPAFADTCRDDAKNYRATAGDIQRTIRKARGSNDDATPPKAKSRPKKRQAVR